MRGRALADLAAAAARGGVTMVQLRMKSSGTRDFIEAGREVQTVLRATGIPLLINDRVDVALAIGAEGVHIGQDDMSADDARRLLGADRIIGLTVHHAHEANALNTDLVDYAGIGPIFSTQSKDPGDPPIGPEGLRKLTEQLPSTPICGIAGIDRTNAAAVIEAGAAGVAVISDIFMADDVERAARQLRTIVDEARS